MSKLQPPPLPVPAPAMPPPLPEDDADYTNQGDEVRHFLLSVFRFLFGFLFVLALLGVGGFIVHKELTTRPLINALKAELNNDIFENMPIEIDKISVKWADKPAENEGSASGKFTVKAKATENLYKPVEFDIGMKKLGITDLYEKEFNEFKDAKNRLNALPQEKQGTLREEIPQKEILKFYNLLVPEGGNVTLTGTVALTNHTGEWSVSELQPNPLSCGDEFTPESKLAEGEYKLDDPQTKEIIDSIINDRKNYITTVDTALEKWEKQVADAKDKAKRDAKEATAKRLAEEKRLADEQRSIDIQDLYDNFDGFCKQGLMYKGTFPFRRVSFNVEIVFNVPTDKEASTVVGTIKIGHTQWKSTIDRDFSVELDTKEGVEYPIAGTINNSKLPTQKKFEDEIITPKSRGTEDADALYNMLRDNTRIDIKFTNKIQISIATSNGKDRFKFDLWEGEGSRREVKRTPLPTGGNVLSEPGKPGGGTPNAMVVPTNDGSLNSFNPVGVVEWHRRAYAPRS